MSDKAIKADVAVIGGINADIWGRPEGSLIPRDSSPGQVSMSPGGVGRNIAHNLRLLGLEVCLVSAVGDDANGDFLLQSCGELGMNTELVRRMEGRRSSCYLYISDEKGDMALAINDMDICAALDTDYISEVLPRLQVKALVLDCNLPAETLEYICNNTKLPIYADPVSTVKSEKLLPIMDRLAAVKPNLQEARALSGRRDAADCAEALVNMGAKRVFISLGEQGMVAAEGGRLMSFPAESIEPVNCSGAGDAAMAAIVYAGVRGLCLDQSANAAQRAAALTCMFEKSNNPAISQIANV